MIELKDEIMTLLLSEPDGPCAYYRGVRFDRSGVFRSISSGGRSYADEWFDDRNPFRHDHLCGPVEEFGPVVRPGGHILKIGVGLLDVCGSLCAPDSGSCRKIQPADGEDAGLGCSVGSVLGHYDRFKLYPVADSGARLLSVDAGKAVFTHRMPDEYEYVKTVRLTGNGSFEISHRLHNLGCAPLVTDVYNHNFFTLGLQEIGPDRCLDFPFRPCGTWREDSVSAYLTDSGIRFGRHILSGEKAFMGNLHSADEYNNPKAGCSFSVSGNSMRVDVSCDAPMHHAVFWSNHRVCCVEPYIAIDIPPGQAFRWTISYLCR